MITDKDMEELRELTRQIRSTKMDVVFFDYGWNECAETIMRYVNKKRTESADQARKEAAERVACAWRERGEDITLRIIRAAILCDSVVKENLITDHIPDAAQKLAIAVKALELIQKRGTYNTREGRTLSGERIDSKTIINEYGIIARDALKEIQG